MFQLFCQVFDAAAFGQFTMPIPILPVIPFRVTADAHPVSFYHSNKHAILFCSAV